MNDKTRNATVKGSDSDGRADDPEGGLRAAVRECAGVCGVPATGAEGLK